MFFLLVKLLTVHLFSNKGHGREQTLVLTLKTKTSSCYAVKATKRGNMKESVPKLVCYTKRKTLQNLKEES